MSNKEKENGLDQEENSAEEELEESTEEQAEEAVSYTHLTLPTKRIV